MKHLILILGLIHTEPAPIVAPLCVTSDQLIANEFNSDERIVIDNDLVEGAAKGFIDRYNAMGIVTYYPGDRVLIFGRNLLNGIRSPAQLMAIFKNDCLQMKQFFRRDRIYFLIFGSPQIGR